MRYSIPSFLSACLLGVALASSDADSTCGTLAAALPDIVYLPDSNPYNASVTSYPFLQLRLEPNCIVRPKTAKDVSTAVNVLRKSGCTNFAVRGGGHNANAGFNNIEDGVTIDMREMNKTEVSHDAKIAKVGAGTLSQAVYDAVEPYNVTALAGRIGVVGLGGFLTGGGISFISPDKGFACDHVVNFEIVLATGEIVNANATSNPDLYTALKGGQNNFGIVTRFDLQTHPQGPVWGGRTFYAPSAAEDLVEAYTDFKLQEYDPYAAGWVTVGYNHTSGNFTPTTTLWYSRPEKKPGGFKVLTEFAPKVQGGMLVAYPSEFTFNASKAVSANSRNTIWATTTFTISPTILHKVFAAFKDLVPKICETYSPTATSELTFQSIPIPSVNGTSANSLGFSAADTDKVKKLISLQLLFFFDNADAMDGLNKALEEFISIFDRLAVEEGLKHDYVYMNYAGWFQNPLASYGKEEYSKLKKTAKKYDPKGLFQKQLVGGFKLFK